MIRAAMFLALAYRSDLETVPTPRGMPLHRCHSQGKTHCCLDWVRDTESRTGPLSPGREPSRASRTASNRCDEGSRSISADHIVDANKNAGQVYRFVTAPGRLGMCRERVDSAQRPLISSSLAEFRRTARLDAVLPATAHRSQWTCDPAIVGSRGCRPSDLSSSTDHRPPRPTRGRGRATHGSAQPNVRASFWALGSGVSTSITASRARNLHPQRPHSSLGCRPLTPRSHRAAPDCTCGSGCPRLPALDVASTGCRSRPTQGPGTSP